MTPLETPRLRLRQFTVEDTDRLVELDSDPAVMRYITYGAPTARETTFTFASDVLTGRSPEECAAAKYSITRSQWQARRP